MANHHFCPEPATFSANTEPQQKRSIIHALARVNTDSDRPDAAEQTIPSYNGFHAGLSPEQGKSKAYFHMSYNQPPSKSVVNDIMDKLTTIIATKRMPFAFLPSPLGHGWELASGRCRPVRHTRPALPTHLPEPELSEDSEEVESDKDNDDEEDNCVPWWCDDSSESSDTDSIDSISDAEC